MPESLTLRPIYFPVGRSPSNGKVVATQVEIGLVTGDSVATSRELVQGVDAVTDTVWAGQRTHTIHYPGTVIKLRPNDVIIGPGVDGTKYWFQLSVAGVKNDAFTVQLPSEDLSELTYEDLLALSGNQLDPPTLPAYVGPQGPAGAGGSVSLTTGENIGGHRAISVLDGEAFHTDLSNPESVAAYIGISTSAVGVGDSITVTLAGEVVEPSWVWGTGVVWVGVNGVLTQTPPVSAAIQVGISTGVTSLLVTPSVSIFEG